MRIGASVILYASVFFSDAQKGPPKRAWKTNLEAVCEMRYICRAGSASLSTLRLWPHPASLIQHYAPPPLLREPSDSVAIYLASVVASEGRPQTVIPSPIVVRLGAPDCACDHID